MIEEPDVRAMNLDALRAYHAANERKYRIRRLYFDRPGRGRVIRDRLTLAEAQAHCSDPETSSSTCTTGAARRITQRNGKWFDSYEEY